MLTARISQPDNESDFKFNKRAYNALRTMYDNIQATPLALLHPLPTKEELPDFLEDEEKE